MTQLVPSPRHSTPPSPSPTRWTYKLPPRRPDDDDGTPFDVAAIGRTLRRRWWLLVLPMLLVGGGAWYWARSRPQLFQAVATVRINDSRSTLASGLGDSRGNAPSAAPSLLTEIEMLRSRRVVAHVIEQEPLGTRVHLQGFPSPYLSQISFTDSTTSAYLPLVFSPEGFTVGGDTAVVHPFGIPVEHAGVRFTVAANAPPSGGGAISVLSVDQAADRLLLGLRVTSREGTNLLDIGYAAGDPQVARRVVNGVALAYQAEDARNAREESRRRRVFLEEQLQRNDAQLQDAEQALGAFRGRQQSYSTEEKFNVEQKGLSELRVRLREAESELRYASSLTDDLSASDGAERRRAQRMLAASSGIGDLPVVQRLNTQLDGYLARRTELTSGRAGKLPSHPDVERVDSLIADVDAALLLAVRAHASVLSARVQSLTELAAASESALRSVPFTEVEEARLAQGAQVLRDQSALLRTEYQRARISEAAAVGHVEVVDLATRAFTLPTPITRVVVFAVFLGLLAGGGLALAGEALDQTVKRRDDIEHRLHLPVLATVPRIEVLPERSGKRFKGLGLGRGAKSTEITAPRSGASEAFRQLTAALFLGRNGDGPRRLVITSAVKGEGKTSIASNLAVSLALQRLRVLLIDCDMHHPKVHEAFGLARSPGLGETVLEGAIPLVTIQPSAVSGLFVLTAGHGGAHPGQVTSSPRFRALVEDMVHDYDVVLLDAPPVLAVADPTVMTLSADAVLMVVRAGRVKGEETLEALRTLASVDAPIVGAVLNDPDGKLAQYGGYSYGYQYS